MKETFLSKFAKIYEYPYGTGFTKHITEKLASYLSKNKTDFATNTENSSSLPEEKQNCFVGKTKEDPINLICQRLQNYYEGYDDSTFALSKRQEQFEKERFLNVRHSEFTHTYDRYLQFLNEEDIIEFESQLKAERKQCIYCHKFYYGNPMAKLNSNVGTDQPDLCEVCCKKYISGLIDSGSENKKIARYLGHPLVVNSKIGVNQASGSNRDSSSVERSEQPKETNKRQRRSETQNKSSKKPKVIEEEKLLKCSKCSKEMEYKSSTHTLDYDLVKEIGWCCLDCKFCINCKKSDQESKLIICEQCDRTYHIHCLSPPMTSIPSTLWYCADCDKCKECKKKLPNKAKAHKIGVHRICDNCNEKYEQNQFCKICMHTYDEEKIIEDFICCDECECWVHASCDGIGKERLKEMEDQGIGYMCPKCKNEQ